MRDPLALRNTDPRLGRDRVRTPMPWQPGPTFGFTTHPRPWLPLGRRSDTETVAAQRADRTSMLHRFRALLSARRSLSAVATGPVTWLNSGPITAYQRGDVLVAMNNAARPATLEAPRPGVVVYSTQTMTTATGSSPIRRAEATITLAPEEAVIIRVDHEA
jgi:glycosidase